MKKFSYILLILLLALISPTLYSTNKIDSLLNKIKTSPNDTNKALSLLQLGKQIRRKNIDSSIIVYKHSLQLSDSLKWNKGVLNSLVGLANCYEFKSEYATSIDYCFKAIKLAEKYNNKDIIAVAYMCLGVGFKNQKEYDKALEYHNKALAIDLELNAKRRIPTHYGNIGVVYSRLKDFDKAIEYYKKALDLEIQLKNTRGQSTHLGNLGVAYKNQKKYAEALDCYKQALKINEEDNTKEGSIVNLANMGVLYTILKQYKDAETCLKEAIQLSKQVGIKRHLLSGYDALSELYEKSGKPVLALENYKLAVAYKDSIFNEDNQKALVQKEMQYNFDKQQAQEKLEQERKDSIANEEKRRQRIITYAISGVALLIFILAIVIFRNLNISKQKNKIISEQKVEVEKQKDIIEEKHKEITDSINYAERIQRSLLANKNLLEKHLTDYFIMFKPRNIVSGDFYWCAELPNQQFALVTGDSTGHGVPGAIMSLLNITCLEKAIEKYQEPNLILNETRKIVINRLKNDGSQNGGQDGMDCSLLIFNNNKTQLAYSGANSEIYILRPTLNNSDNSSGKPHYHLFELKGDKMPIGRHQKQDEPFNIQTFALQKGDILYTLTDGFTDQFGGKNGKKFMLKNFKTLLLSIAHLEISEQHQQLENTFNEWKKNVEQIDDVTVIGIKI